MRIQSWEAASSGVIEPGSRDAGGRQWICSPCQERRQVRQKAYWHEGREQMRRRSVEVPGRRFIARTGAGAGASGGALGSAGGKAEASSSSLSG